jgi:putative membrane protein
MGTRIPDDKKATEYLANERTFLAWIRTAISILSLGFVVAKFGVWLRELASRIDPGAHVTSSSYSLPIGVAMMTLGSALAVLAAWHYHVTNVAIGRGEVKANRGLVVTVTGGVVLLAAVMIAYMLLTVNRL